MEPIYLLAGPPAVGKSTTAHALAGTFPRSIHIPVDDLRGMVVSGMQYPGADWNTDLIEQLHAARQSALQMALTYREHAFTVVIDDFWDPASRLGEYGQLFQVPGVHKILLFPSRAAAQARNLKRAGAGEGSAYIAEGIRSVYEQLEQELDVLRAEGWLVVDTTERNAAETAASLRAAFG